MSDFVTGRLARIRREIFGQEELHQDPLGYARGISKKDATQLIRDPRFLQDVVDFYRERDGSEFDTQEEAIERFFQDRTWRNMNTLSLGRDYFGSKGMSEAQRQRLGRLQSIYESYPNPWEEGGRGWHGVRQGVAAALLDPINLIGFGAGSVAAKGAARGAQTAIRTAEQAGQAYKGVSPTRAGLTAAAKKGALYEGALSGAITGGFDYGMQKRDIEVGLQDEVNPWQVAASTALGGAAGGVLGGAFGAAGSAFAMPGAKTSGGRKARSAIGQGIDEANEAFDDQLRLEAREAVQRQADAAAAAKDRSAETPEVGSAWDRYLGSLDKRVRSTLDEAAPDEPSLAAGLSKLNAKKLTGIEAVDQIATTAASMRVLRTAPARIQGMQEQAAKAAQVDPAAAEALYARATEEAAIYERVTEHLIKGEWNEAEELAQSLAPSAGPAAPDAPAAPAGEAAQTVAPGATPPPAAPNAAASAPPEPGATATSAPSPATGDAPAAGTAAPTREDFRRQHDEAKAKAETQAAEAKLAELETEEQQLLASKERLEAADDTGRTQVETQQPEYDRINGRLKEIEAERAGIQEKLTQAQEEPASAPAATEQPTPAATGQAEEPVAAAAAPAPEEVARAKAKIDEEQFIQQVTEVYNDAQELLKELKGGNLNSIVEVVRTQREPWIDGHTGSWDGLVDGIRSLHEGLYGTKPSKAQLAADYRDWRKTNGITAKGAESWRAWANEVLLDMEASNDVAEILGTTFVADRMHSGAFNIEAMDVLLQVASNLRHPTRGADYTDRLARHYRAWVAENAAEIQGEAFVRAGPDDAEDLMRAQFGDGLIEFIDDLAREVKSADPKQRIAFKPKDADEALSKVKWSHLIPEGTKPEKIKDISEMVAKVVAKTFRKGATMDHIQWVVSYSVNKVLDPDYAPGYHMGRSVPGMDYGKHGTHITRNTLGGVQSILRGSNSFGYRGRPMSGMRQRGEDGTIARILDAEEAAATAIDEAYVAAGTQRMVRNQFQAEKNAEQVVKIDEAIKAIRKTRKDKATKQRLPVLSDEQARALYAEAMGTGDAAEGTAKTVIRRATQEEIDSGTATINEQAQRYIQSTQEALEKRKLAYPGQIMGWGRVDQVPATRPDGSPLQTGDTFFLSDGSVHVFMKSGAAEQRKLESLANEARLQDKAWYDANVEARALLEQGGNTDPVLRERMNAAQQEANHAKVLSDQAKAEIDQIKKRIEKRINEGKYKDARSLNGQLRAMEEWQDKLYQVSEAQSRTLDREEMVSRLQKQKLSLTQTTNQALRGDEVVNKLSVDDERILKRLWGERSALIEKMGANPTQTVKERLLEERKAVEAAIEKVAPGYIAARKLERKRRNALKKLREIENAKPEAERRTEQQLIDEVNASLAAKGEPPVTTKDADVVRTAEDLEAHEAAANAQTQASVQGVIEEFRESGNLDALRAAVERIMAERGQAKAAGATPPTTKPIGGYTPMVVVKRGFEVDVRNHFHLVNREAGVYDIVLTVDNARQNVGTLSRLEDGSFEVLSSAEDGLRMVYGSMPAAQRGFADVFDGVLDLHAQQGRFRQANVITNSTHVEPDWKKTNTYKGAPEEAATNPPASAAAEDAADPTISNLVASYPISEDRDFAVQILSGELAGVVRTVPRTRNRFDNVQVGEILGRAKAEKFVIGTVDLGASSNSAKASTTFRPLKEGESYIQPNKEGPTTGSRFADDPDVIPAAHRPLRFSKLAETETKKADIDAVFADASGEVRESLLKRYGNAQAVFDEILGLENVSWTKLVGAGDHSTPLERFDGFTAHLAKLYQLQARLAPHGVQLPNVRRRASMNQLAAIFGETRKDELAAVFNILRQLGGDGESMPKFRGDPTEGYNYTAPRSDAAPGEANAINVTVGDTASGQPEFTKTIHEIFHWAYLNVLAPEDRMTFWRAMRNYVNEGGLAEGDLLARLPNSASNELKSPAEFFANQGTMWALGQGRAGPADKLATLWKKIASAIDWIVGRFFGKRYEDSPHFIGPRNPKGMIDENLVPLFERILPDEVLEGTRYEGLVAQYNRGKGGDKSLSFYAKKLDDYEKLKGKISKALMVEDEGQLLEALVPDQSGSVTFIGEAYRLAGKREQKWLPRKQDGSKGGIRIRMFDGGEKAGERLLASGQVIDIVNDPNGYFIRAKMLRTMREIQKEVASRRADRKVAGQVLEQADEDARIAEIEALMRTQEEGDEIGVPVGDWDAVPEGMRVIEGMTQTESGSEIANLKLLASQAVEVLDEAQAFIRRKVGASIPRKNGEGIRINAQGQQQATQRSSEQTRHARRATARKRAQEKRNAEAAQAVMDDLENMVNDPPPSVAAGGEGVAAPSFHDMSSDALIKSLAGQSKRSPEKRAMAAELLRRERAKPEVGEGPFEASPEFAEVNDAALYNGMLTWLERGKPEEVTKRVREMMARNFDVEEVFNTRKRSAKADPIIHPKTSRIGHALQVELEQTAGLQQHNGVPPDAPAAIQEALLKLTHRDKDVENILRTMAYRMFNLMGRTERDLAGQADFISVEDVYRLAGTDAPPEVRGAFKEISPLEGEGFNQMRKDMRRFAIGLKSGKGDPIDLMHEFGHMVVRATFSREQMEQIVTSYSEALVKGERLAANIASKYGDRNMAASAEEWFVEGWAQYLAERVAKGDVFKVREGEAPLRLKGQLERFIDQLIEYVAYAWNGLIGNNSIRQQYRQLTFYGDMFAGARAKTPYKTAVTGTGSYAVAPSVAPRYTREVVDSMPDWKRQLAAEFVSADPSEDLSAYVFYHGTPNGRAFRRDTGLAPVLEPSAPDALYGPGVYVINSRGMAANYSNSGHGMSVRRMVDSATDNPRLREEGYVIADMIGQKTAQIAELNFELTFTGHSSLTRKRAAKAMADNNLDELASDDPVRTFIANERKLERLLNEEKQLWDLLESTVGVPHEPAVLPLFVRATEPFDFREGAVYHMNGGRGDISWLPYWMHKNDYLSHEGVDVLKRQREPMSGSDLFELLTEDAMLRNNKASDPADAKLKLQTAMRELGYDSYHVTESDFAGLQSYDAMVLFDSHQVKHVDADYYDVDRSGIYNSLMGGEMNVTAGKIAADMVESGRGLAPSDVASISRELDNKGVTGRVREIHRKMMRGQELTADDAEAARGYGIRSILRENSSALRRMGAHWFGNIMKPEHGPGFFDKHHADLADILQPVLAELRDLDDAPRGLRGWAQRSGFAGRAVGSAMAGAAAGSAVMPGAGTLAGSLGGLAVGFMWGRSYRPKPVASHQRILRAMRQGREAMESLRDPKERALAFKIQRLLKEERIRVEEAGLPIGDVTKSGRTGTYVPQLWDAEAVRVEPEKFVQAMAAWFRKESRNSDMGPLSPAKARETAENMMKRIIDEDGSVADSGFNPFGTSSSDPFFQRFIHLTAEEVPEMERFLVNDLEGIMTKYFNRTIRKRSIARDFGAGGHGFKAYMTIAQKGRPGAVEVLTSSKVSLGVRGFGEDAIEVETIVVPSLTNAKGHVDRLMAEVDQVLGPTRRTAMEAKDKARQLLLGQFDPDDLSVDQWRNYKSRVDAIVNGLVDFREKGASSSLLGFMQRYWHVINQRPVDGDDGTGMIYKVSRGLRGFNSITMLGFATLTSLPDLGLPLIRSGNVGAWYKGMRQWASTDPAYRQMIRNVGVGVEQLLHDRMVGMAGDASQRFTTSFFNMQLLTPWTNMSREMAGLVGYNAFKAEMDIARRYAMQGKTNSVRYQTAMRFLERYGLAGEGAKRQGGIDFSKPDSPRIEDANEWARNPQLRYALMRFTNEAVFVPDPNDVPIWAQSPIGALVYQLKSFPVMAGRMSWYVVKELMAGNPRPAMYMATVGAGLGASAAGVKDVVQFRGGEDNEQAAFRIRQTGNTAIGSALHALGLPEKDLGPEEQQLLAWYFDGLLHLGGLGLLGELAINSAAHVDDQNYGFNRVLSSVAGPSYDTAYVGFRAVAGAKAAAMGDPEDTTTRAAMRSGARAVAARTPVLGGVRAYRETVADGVAEAGRQPTGDSAPLGQRSGFRSAGMSTSGFDTQGGSSDMNNGSLREVLLGELEKFRSQPREEERPPEPETAAKKARRLKINRNEDGLIESIDIEG